MTSYVQYNPTMATASMTMASQSVDHHSSDMSSSIDPFVESRDVLIEKMKSNLIRYARSNDRRMVLRCLKDARFLSYVPMDAADEQLRIPISELEKEISKEEFLLNGISLKPYDQAQAKNVCRNDGTSSGSLKMIRTLAQILCEGTTMDGNNLYERVINRVAKTSAEPEVYYHINAMMGNTTLSVKQLSPEQISKEEEASVTDLKLYETGGQIQMVLETTHSYGLFREKDAIINRPWIIVHCKVHERANLSNNESFRSMNIKTPSLY